MRIIIFVLLMWFLIGCDFSNYKISRLEHKQLNFEELPSELRNYLSSLPKCDNYNMLSFVDLADTNNFSLETTLIGPWVDYEKLIDKQKNISYKINQGVPDPYIIFKNKLYIPDRFNILCGGNIFDAKYTEYHLK